MRRFIATAALLALAPSLARAAPILVRPTSQTMLPGETVAVEVFADLTTLTPGFNERLNAYTMTLSAARFTGPNDPSFVVPANFTFDLPQGNPYVFGPSDPPFDPTGSSNRSQVFLSATASSPAEVDLTEARNGFARVMVSIPANMPLGMYVLRVDQDFLSLGTAGATPIEAIGGTGTLGIIPEPVSLGLLAAGGLLALRRRRTT